MVIPSLSDNNVLFFACRKIAHAFILRFFPLKLKQTFVIKFQLNNSTLFCKI